MLHKADSLGTVVVQLLVPGAKANTAAATTAWTAISKYKGDMVLMCSVGTVTAGSVTWTVEAADLVDGTGGAAITLVEGPFTVVTTSNDPLAEKRIIPAGSIKPFMRVIGTVATGPADAAVLLLGLPGGG